MLQKYIKYKTHQDYIKTIKEGFILTENIMVIDHKMKSDFVFTCLKINNIFLDKLNFKLSLLEPKDYIDTVKVDILFNFIEDFNFYPKTIISFFGETSFSEQEFTFETFEYFINKEDVTKIDLLFSAEYNIDGYTNKIKVPPILYHITNIENTLNKTKYKTYSLSFWKNDEKFHNDYRDVFFVFEDLNKTQDVLKFIREIECNNTDEYVLIEFKPHKYPSIINLNFLPNEDGMIEHFILNSCPKFKDVFYTRNYFDENECKVKIIQRNL